MLPIAQLPTPNAQQPAPAPRGTSWLSVADASRRSGMSQGHIARLCGSKWLAEGLARTVAGGGRRTRWEVREDADAAFARVRSADQIGLDLRAFTAAQRETAAKRKTILDGWAEAKRGGFQLGFVELQITAQYCQRLQLDEGINVSRPTLFGWAKRYREGGLAALIDKRGRSNAQCPAPNDPFLAEVQRLWLGLRKLKLSVCMEIAALKAQEQGWEICSRQTCQRHIGKIPQPVVLKMRFGEEAYVNHAEPFIDRDYSPLESNASWCSDHHQFDVLVIGGDGKFCRPWITAWQDQRSRKIVGWRIFDHAPNSDTILQSFRDAALEHGLPAHVYVDNGKDYDCYTFNGRTKKERWARRKIKAGIEPKIETGMFPSLNITVTHALPYHGQSKGIEREFGTVETRTPVWPTYCGKDVLSKPEDLDAQLDAGHAPTLDEFRSWFADWIAGWDATHEHAGDSMDGKTPNQVFAENLLTKRTAPRELLDLYCLRHSKPLKVSQNGVVLDGLRYGRSQSELFKRLGQTVTIRSDDADRSHVLLFDESDRFVCIAEANERVPANASSQEIRQAMSIKRKHRSLLREYIDQRPRMTDDLPDLLVRGRAARLAAQGPSEPIGPPTISPVRSALEGDLPAIRAAVENRAPRVAVGAESFSYIPRRRDEEDADE